MIACPYCGAGRVEEAPQPLLDLASKALGEARLALEARASGRPLREIASAIVSGDRPEPSAADRRCPYCRRGSLPVSTTSHLALDLAVWGLGFARLYWLAGGGRRLRWIELGELVLDGKVREHDEHEGEDEHDEDEDETDEHDEAPEVASFAQARAARGVVVPGNAAIIDLDATDETFL